MTEKYKGMCISVQPEMQEQMKLAARKLRLTGVSELIRELVSKYLDLLINDSGDTPVILRIPAEIQSDPQKLKEWLDAKSDAIVKALSS